MNRGQLRILSVLLGIVLGTICALTYRMYRMASAPNHPSGGAHAAVDDDLDEDDPWEMAQNKPRDPGRRNDLASLVKSSKSEPWWLKEFEFVDQSGEKVSSESLRGEAYVACFFFTTCPGSCPRQTSQMQLLQNKYKGRPIRFVSISVDPKIDTQEVLAEYAKKFGADPTRWHFLRGPMEYVTKVGMEKFFFRWSRGTRASRSICFGEC